MAQNLKEMTQEEFDQLMIEVNKKLPKLYQIIVDFVHKRFTIEEVEEFINMEQDEQCRFIRSYQARI